MPDAVADVVVVERARVDKRRAETNDRNRKETFF